MSTKPMRPGTRFRWIWVTAAVLAVMLGGVYVTMEFAVSYTLKQFSELSELAEGTDPPVKEEGTGTAPISRQEDSVKPGKQQQPVNDGARVEPKPGTGSASAEPPQGERAEFTYTPELTVEKAQAVEEKITTREKLTVANTLLQNFSADELKAFASLAVDGITVEDKRAARKMFLERLNEEEYNRLIAIAAKYGLSEGKTYQEVVKRSRNKVEESER